MIHEHVDFLKRFRDGDGHEWLMNMLQTQQLEPWVPLYLLEQHMNSYCSEDLDADSVPVCWSSSAQAENSVTTSEPTKLILAETKLACALTCRLRREG